MDDMLGGVLTIDQEAIDRWLKDTPGEQEEFKRVPGSGSAG
jgi:hypothetical protein